MGIGMGGDVMEQNLTASAEEADFLVDLSNVVRNREIGARGLRSLRRLQLVVDALADHVGDRNVRFYLVADRSLRAQQREFNDPADLRLLGQWVEKGLVEELPDADERILELAEMTGVPVISSDFYRDFRLAFPWIQGNTWQFLKPVPAPGGAVRLEPRDMGVAAAADISRKMEETDLKRHGLLRGRDRKPLTDVVRRNWRCPDSRCTLYDARRGTSVLLPLMRGGSPVCRLHRTELVDDGPRTARAQLKLLIEGECVERFTLDDGSTVRVGRAPGDGGIALHTLVPERLAGGLSRAHVELRVTGGIVHVRDLSSYGTQWRTIAGAAGPGPWKRLAQDKERQFDSGYELRLVEGVVLSRSGRRFPTELAAAWRRNPPAPPGDAAAPARLY